MGEPLLCLLHALVLADGFVAVKLVREPTQHCRKLRETALLRATVRAKEALYQTINQSSTPWRYAYA